MSDQPDIFKQQLPFILARLTLQSQQQNNQAFGSIVDCWVVMIAFPDFVKHNCEWMNLPEMGQFCLRPDVDILTEEIHEFGTLQEARTFVKAWWAKQ